MFLFISVRKQSDRKGQTNRPYCIPCKQPMKLGFYRNCSKSSRYFKKDISNNNQQIVRYWVEILICQTELQIFVVSLRERDRCSFQCYSPTSYDSVHLHVCQTYPFLLSNDNLYGKFNLILENGTQMP